MNYRIHTDAVRDHLIPPQITKTQIVSIYASEADLMNVALFGMTAAQWRTANPKTPGNMRDVASLEQPVVLSNLESINSMLIHQGMASGERLRQLNQIAIAQMSSLVRNQAAKKLSAKPRARTISRLGLDEN